MAGNANSAMINTHIERRKTPEEEELLKKLAELASLESTLIQKELELRTLQAELSIFKAKYAGILGIRYAELRKIQAEIEELIARLDPEGTEAQKRAEEARFRAEEAAREARRFLGKEKRQNFSPSDSLKNLYRRAAKRIHPDLATDERERAHRQHFMAEVNRAYEDGNEARLEEILREWESSPDHVIGEGVGSELIRVIRKIAQVEQRLQAIERDIAKLKGSELYKLKLRAEEAQRQGRDLLREMAWELDEQISSGRETLRACS